jgi:hypothetical protein
MSVGITIEGGINIGGNITIGGTMPSITVYPGDISFLRVDYTSATYTGASSAGFTSISGSVPPYSIINGVLYVLSGATLVQYTALLTDYPFLASPTAPYAWNVSWNTGGSGVVRMAFGYSNSDSLLIAPIDTTFSNWQTTNTYDVPLLAGTFTFPATFTLYNPTTELITGQADWC